MSIEQYIKYRNAGKQIEEIQNEYLLSEATALTLELGYQCYLKNISLDKAINLVDRIVILSADESKHTTFNPIAHM